MTKILRIVPATLLVGFTILVTTAGMASASTSAADHGYTCKGGTIPPGTYGSMDVAGVCYMPAGTIVVRHNLIIEPRALLDAAATPGDPAAAPVLPATVVVDGSVWVNRGAVLALGCSPAGGCHGVTYDHIGGNLTAINAEATLIQAVAIGGTVTVAGGGGGVVGGPASGGCFNPAAPIPKPWSLDPALSNPQTGSPQYTDFEDSSIGGDFTVTNVQTCYLASFRDRVAGSVTVAANTTSDPDGMEFENNLVSGNMTCVANRPAVQYGDSGAAPNVVVGMAAGQCGFNVVQPSPAHGGPSLMQHVSVKAGSLGTFDGTHRQTANVATKSLGRTESGNRLLLQLNNVVFAGGGLTGNATVAPGSPPGQSGEAVAVTVSPDGSESFEAFDSCACSFDGQSGTVRIEAYGTASAKGLVSGVFLIVSGGGAGGHLETLAGWGTFSSSGEPRGTLGLVAHLKIS